MISCLYALGCFITLSIVVGKEAFYRDPDLEDAILRGIFACLLWPGFAVGATVFYAMRLFRKLVKHDQ